VRLHGLHYGQNLICLVGGGGLGLVNSTCMAIQRILPTLELEITDPGEGIVTQLPNFATVRWWGSNVTSLRLTVDGSEVATDLPERGSRYFEELPWGDTVICLEAQGPSNQIDAACVIIRRPIPPIDFRFLMPENGSNMTSGSVFVMYDTGNMTSGNWTLDGTVIGTILISMSSIYLESLDYGTHVLCADLRGHADTSDLICLTFTVVPPPLELTIITPQLDQHEADDWIDLEVEVANATHLNISLNGGEGDLHLIGSQRVWTVSNLNADENTICVTAIGQQNQTLTRCVTFSAQMLDTDNDGIIDRLDECDFSPVPQVDPDGCAPIEKDADLDGVLNELDDCPDTPSIEIADGNGCSPSQRDLDLDSVADDIDACPTTPGTDDGCPVLTITLELVEPLTLWNQTANISVTVSCEDGCEMSFSDDSSTSKVIDGTWVISVAPGTTLYNASVEIEGASAEANLTLTWPDQPSAQNDTSPLNNSTDANDTNGTGAASQDLEAAQDERGGMSWTLMIGMIVLVVLSVGAFVLLSGRSDEETFIEEQPAPQMQQDQWGAQQAQQQAQWGAQQPQQQAQWGAQQPQQQTQWGAQQPQQQMQQVAHHPGREQVGEIANDGYEYIEWPAQSGTWYYRDVSTGEWVIWQ